MSVPRATFPKPSFSALWTAFPDHVKFTNMKALYTYLGGKAVLNLKSAGFGDNGNTCASRMSVAFNETGHRIPRSAGYATISAADKSQIIFRVRDFRSFLLDRLGQPLVDTTFPFDDQFADKQGIVVFSVNWSGPTGHVALWNGKSFREPTHDDYSRYSEYSEAERRTLKTTKAELWELPM